MRKGVAFGLRSLQPSGFGKTTCSGKISVKSGQREFVAAMAGEHAVGLCYVLLCLLVS